jgi:hypothetical protein
MAGLIPDRLAPQTIRLDQPGQAANEDDVQVEIVEGQDEPEINEDGAVLRIVHGDGSVTVSLDGKPIADAQREGPDTGWFANLAERIEGPELSKIADDLLRGIDADDQSRKDWIESVATGIKLLGLKTEIPASGSSGMDGAPVEGMSRVRHPLLLEAVLRFQANARSELLPSDGPVKVRDDQNGGTDTIQSDQTADALELDLNHYLTAIATEYYPDTDRMLFKFGLAGTSFKKVYFCPLRMRPVSETVDANDLIVSNEATDLANARRVTHKVMLKPSTVTRLQILGVYRDLKLTTPNPEKTDALKQAEKEQQGVTQDATYPEDRDREIYECYCELNIQGYEHKWKGRESGLELPYRVTIDVTSREVLSIVRNYNRPKPDAKTELPTARKTFVKYGFVPGLGFYDIGLLDILGNTTNAVTAAWREMLDNGMFANFPGWLQADFASRQNTNVVRVAPGSGQVVKTNGMKIGDAIMPLPYNTQQMAPLMSLVENMAETGQRIGGTSELQVGEGRADAPVGTTLAMVEQATKLLNSVHKRMHASQAEEFQLLVEVFREHPDSFVRNDTPSDVQWTHEMFLKALDDHDLVPQADPNTASHTQRMLKGMGLKQLQAASPSLYDPVAIDTFIIQSVLGFSNPKQFFVPPTSAPPPELQAAQAKTAADTAKAGAETMRGQAAMITAQARAHEAQTKTLGDQPQQPDPVDLMKAKASLLDAETKRHALHLDAVKAVDDSQNQVADRQTKAHSDLIDLAKTVLDHHHDAEMAAREVPKVEKEIGA